jgi:hypothetical protein
MTIRPAYPDELGRAQALLDGHPVPKQAAFLVAVREQPVERILAVIPWWPQAGEDEAPQLRFHLSRSGLEAEILEEILQQLDALALEQNASALLTDFSLAEAHPLYLALSARGYEVCQTDRYFTVPGEIVKSRSLRIYQRLGPRIPPPWRIETLRGQDPEKLFALVAAHRLMSPQQFQNYWNGASRERFEADYSCVVLEEDEIIGLFLITQRGDDELHIHVEAASPARAAQSALISASLRNASFSRCPAGFPKVFTCRADSEKHRQTGNTALRQGGTEAAPRHFLRKRLR